MKFEFGDLHKFTVSVGLVVVSLALIVPWIFLREDFDLLLTKDQLSELTPLAQTTIEKRQSFIDKIITIIPWVSGIGFLSGLVAIFYGLCNWSKNQKYIDSQHQLDTELKVLSVRDATSDEITESIEEEVRLESQMDLAVSQTPRHLKKYIAHHSEVEITAINRFADTYESDYDVQPHRYVNGMEIDIVLKGKSYLQKDYIIELKYIRKGFNFGWLEQAFLNNVLVRNHYAHATNRLPNTLLLVLTGDDVIGKKDYEAMLSKLINKQRKRSAKNRVIILEFSEFKNLSTSELRSKIHI